MKSLLGKLGVILIGLSIFTYAEVWGADWKLFHNDEESFDYYDAEGITRLSGDIVKVWAKRVYTKEGVINAVQKLGKDFEKLSFDKHLLEINCVDKKELFLHSISYSEKGEVIYSNNKPKEWNFIAPETVAETLYKKVCK